MDETRVRAKLRHAAALYLQCGLKISSIQLIASDSPTKSTIVDGPDLKTVGTPKDSDLKIASLLPQALPRPAAFFIDSSQNRDEVYKNGSTAYAYPQFMVNSMYATDGSPLFGTAWITAKILSPAYRAEGRNPTYSVVAHELGHILSNAGHTNSAGLMSGNYKLVSGKVEGWLCEDLTKSPFVRPIN